VKPYRKPHGRELSRQEHQEELHSALPSTEVASHFVLGDDIGTTYRWMPGPSHGIADSKASLVYWSSATYTPPVPAEATKLVAKRESSLFEIPLGA
jgi:hypothetical protein